MTSGNDEVRITLRIPAELRDRLTDAASASGRSMNGEMLVRLNDSFIATESLSKALALMTEMSKERKHNRKVLQWMLAQIKLRDELIDSIMSDETPMSDNYKATLKAIIEKRGMATDFPEEED